MIGNLALSDDQILRNLGSSKEHWKLEYFSFWRRNYEYEGSYEGIKYLSSKEERCFSLDVLTMVSSIAQKV